MGQSRPAIASIIETETNWITGSKTLNWFRTSTTSAYTGAVNSGMGSGGSLAASVGLGTLHLITTNVTTNEKIASLLGVAPVTSPTRLKISASVGRSNHPTHKPIALMRWLIRLVTREGQTVLDPFTGSGTTGCAAALEGRAFIGIEREPDYIAIAEARIKYWAEQPQQLPLFANQEV